MQLTDSVASLKQALPELQVLTPEAPGWAERRATRGHAGQECKPLGIAIPKDAEQVAGIVRWATASGVNFTVRTGGNDFFGRYVADDSLIIDMREINSIEIAADKKTATIGGGTIGKELIFKLEEAGLVAPTGNVWTVGYVGWATLGGYGPLTNLLGMGAEGIVGAEVVTAKGEVVKATDDMLEGIRGMGGNLGVITSLTIKVYEAPGTKPLSGMIMMEATPDNIKAVIAAEKTIDFPSCVNLHHFVMKPEQRMLAVLFTWMNPDHEKGKQFLRDFLSQLPPVAMNTVDSKTIIKHYQDVPEMCLPWGGQRSLYIKEMSPKIVDLATEALEDMPQGLNLGWSMATGANGPNAPPNCFGAGPHMLLSFTDMVPEEHLLDEARKWNNKLYEKLRASGDPAILEGSYPPLTRPADRSAQQLFGDKWKRAEELKARYDPDNVFKFAVPKM